MTKDEAIKELEKDIADFGGPGTSPICQAEKLGIEALTLCKRCRNTQPVWLPMFLPSETE